jgi:IclR family acetate operon transcriptional repressor
MPPAAKRADGDPAAEQPVRRGATAGGGSGRTATRPLTSAGKTLAVLDAIAEFRRPFRAPEIAAELGWSRATTYQQLVTLVAAGWLDRIENGEYRLSVRAAKLSAAAAAQAGPSDRIVEVMRELVEQTREAATVAIPDQEVARVMWRVIPDRSVWASVPFAGELTPVSASGQILIAYLPDDQRRELRRKVKVPSDRQCAGIRAAGVAHYLSSDPDGVTAVAAPIFGAPGVCAAALALTGPAHRFETGEAVRPLIAAAERISTIWQRIGDPLTGH